MVIVVYFIQTVSKHVLSLKLLTSKTFIIYYYINTHCVIIMKSELCDIKIRIKEQRLSENCSASN